MEKIDEIEKEVQKLREEINELQKIVATLIASIRRYEIEYGVIKWAERYWRWAVDYQEYI